ncbi:hypothetical protein BGW38_002832 [Lunasporangiospora selenospora]|uniref:NodB homology domain-containing protein n=1 Tax=Lunasporangiospora selenospora TaxID=979761 RepID=A0A9P6FRT6_9FUNG|nr:hypothetical protein BGW38_002832 [Lunasporangiospora selenospora]
MLGAYSIIIQASPISTLQPNTKTPASTVPAVDNDTLNLFKSNKKIDIDAIYAESSEEKINQLDRLSQAGVILNCTVPRTLALTFDDGPYKFTNSLLDLLKKYNVTATFFMNGENWSNIRNYTTVVKRAFDEGHQLGSHTYTHPDLTNLTNPQIYDQMTKLDDAFLEIIKVRPIFMRPPFGYLNNRVIALLKSMEYKIVLWNINTNDWDHPKDIDQSLGIYKKNLEAPGAITKGFIGLEHDTHVETATILAEKAILYARSLNFTLATVGECTGDRVWYRL